MFLVILKKIVAEWVEVVCLLYRPNLLEHDELFKLEQIILPLVLFVRIIHSTVGERILLVIPFRIV